MWHFFFSFQKYNTITPVKTAANDHLAQGWHCHHLVPSEFKLTFIFLGSPELCDPDQSAAARENQHGLLRLLTRCLPLRLLLRHGGLGWRQFYSDYLPDVSLPTFYFSMGGWGDIVYFWGQNSNSVYSFYSPDISLSTY